MTLCAEPIGILGCSYQAHDSEPVPERCYHHAKKRAGLYTCPEKGCALPIGHRHNCSPVSGPRRSMSPDALFSDESQEIVRLLRSEMMSV